MVTLFPYFPLKFISDHLPISVGSDPDDARPDHGSLAHVAVLPGRYDVGAHIVSEQVDRKELLEKFQSMLLTLWQLLLFQFRFVSVRPSMLTL